MLEIFNKYLNLNFNLNKPITYLKILLFFSIMSFIANTIFKILN